MRGSLSRRVDLELEVKENEMPYVVMVDDNYHHGDANYRYQHGEFADAGVALEHCRKIVNGDLDEAHKLGMSAEELWEQYMSFGEDPFILSADVTPVAFSAWDYARERCAQLCPMRQEELFQDRAEDPSGRQTEPVRDPQQQSRLSPHAKAVWNSPTGSSLMSAFLGSKPMDDGDRATLKRLKEGRPVDKSDDDAGTPAP